MKKLISKDKIMKRSIPVENVDDYLKAIPEKARVVLENLRSTIKKVAPKASEKISYGIPTFNYLSPLVGFAVFKNHCSFYVMSYKVMDIFKKELEPYDKATATIRFSPDKPLPAVLVKRLVRARLEENEGKKKGG
jgi:uncharacterized protein YdhG (YjbR/CyaY superfamily)